MKEHDDKEYAIVVVKPDGMKENIIPILERMLKEHDLTIVKRKKVQLKKEDIYRTIVTKFNVEEYAEYMTESEVTVFLIYGIEAIWTMIGIKQKIRAMYGFSSNTMKNLVHSTDCREYIGHMQLLFPELDLVTYGTYGDMTIVVSETIYEDLVELCEKGCINRIGLLANHPDEFPDLQKYQEESKIRIIYGIVKKLWYHNEEIQLIGYYRNRTEVPDFPNNTDFTVESYIKFVRQNHGICILDYRPYKDDSAEFIEELKELGIHGVVVYDPRFPQPDTACLEIICEDDLELLLTGGTHGMIQSGTLGVDKATYMKFARKIQE